MRDYYTAYVSSRVEKTQERRDSEGAKGAEGSFAPFAPSVEYGSLEKFTIEPLVGVPNEDGPGTDMFEERVAIMMYDGGLTEPEAVKYLIANRLYTADAALGLISDLP